MPTYASVWKSYRPAEWMYGFVRWLFDIVVRKSPLMAEGRTNAAICARLGIGVKTVEAHVNTIFSKLGLEPAQDDNRRVLAVLAFLHDAAVAPVGMFSP